MCSLVWLRPADVATFENLARVLDGAGEAVAYAGGSDRIEVGWRDEVRDDRRKDSPQRTEVSRHLLVQGGRNAHELPRGDGVALRDERDVCRQHKPTSRSRIPWTFISHGLVFGRAEVFASFPRRSASFGRTIDGRPSILHQFGVRRSSRVRGATL